MEPRHRPPDVSQTVSSFRDKWQHNPSLALAETLREGSDIFNWIIQRNGLQTPEGLRRWLSGRRRILDAGCGNGRVTALLRRYAPSSAEVVGVDVSSADVARTNLAGLPRLAVHEGDLLGDLSRLGRFDLIYCQEVLHHTPDPRRALLNLSGLLAEGGELAVYVYRRKGPMREYADDYVRGKVSGLPYDEAMAAMRQVTAFGQALAEANLRVSVPAVDLLEIEAGEYDVQRLLYHFFFKCFWNPALDFEANAAINFDWYHPQVSSRHTLDEVLSWFADAGLTVVHRHVDHYGITVRATR